MHVTSRGTTYHAIGKTYFGKKTQRLVRSMTKKTTATREGLLEWFCVAPFLLPRTEPPLAKNLQDDTEAVVEADATLLSQDWCVDEFVL